MESDSVPSPDRRHILKSLATGAAALSPSSHVLQAFSSKVRPVMTDLRHATVQVGDVSVFYREAGVKGQPVLLLLHGFANSSHYFRHLMPMLAKRFHLIAPDIPSFGKADRRNERIWKMDVCMRVTPPSG